MPEKTTSPDAAISLGVGACGGLLGLTRGLSA